jgi:hypothetical protein
VFQLGILHFSIFVASLVLSTKSVLHLPIGCTFSVLSQLEHLFVRPWFPLQIHFSFRFSPPSSVHWVSNCSGRFPRILVLGSQVRASASRSGSISHSARVDFQLSSIWFLLQSTVLLFLLAPGALIAGNNFFPYTWSLCRSLRRLERTVRRDLSWRNAWSIDLSHPLWFFLRAGID